MDQALSKNLKYTILFIGIFLLGFFLRFFLLGSVPVSIHRDEAFLGYNAFSILKTGKDISGNFLPIHLESFFYSPAGYSYLSMPSIFVFGLSEFSVRFPSALLGTLTILLVYLISLSLFKDSKNKYLIAILSSLMLAIIPWHVNLSRVGAESTAVVFFISLGVLLYLKFLEGKNRAILILSFLSFGVNFFIYQAPRAFLPLFLPLLAFSKIEIKSMLRSKLFIALYFFIIILPVISILLSPTLSLRIQSLSIFNHPETKLVIQEQLVNDGVLHIPSLASRATHNKIVGYSLLFFDNYFYHFSYKFLFSDGGFPERFRIPNIGLLYIFQLPFIIFSFLRLSKKSSKIGLLLFGWIGLAMFGSALTYDDIPNLQRTLISVPAFAILTGYGMSEIISEIRNKKYYWPFVSGLFLIVLFSVFYFFIQYFIQGKVYRTWNRQDGYKDLVQKTTQLLPSYNKAIITSKETAPTILFLFYSKYDPKRFQEETRGVDTQKSDRINYQKLEFSDEDCPLRIDDKTKKLTGKKGILYVNSSICKKDVPGTRLLYTIKRYGEFSEVFQILDVK